MSLVLNNVAVAVSDKHLIQDISISCEPGKILGVVGENGAGKSTLLNVISGMTLPSQGSVSLNSKPMTNYSNKDLAKIRSVLPQGNELTFPLPCVEVVRLAIQLGDLSIPEQNVLIQECLAIFDVLHLANQNYLALSGGEKQRVQLSRVLAQLQCHRVRMAGYLLLDEPISALDVYQQYKTLAVLKQLASDGIGIIVILHDLNLASMFCHHIAVIKGGRLVGKGEPADVVTPATIKDAFGIEANIQNHPDTGTPMVLPKVTHSNESIKITSFLP